MLVQIWRRRRGVSESLVGVVAAARNRIAHQRQRRSSDGDRRTLNVIAARSIIAHLIIISARSMTWRG